MNKIPNNEKVPQPEFDGHDWETVKESDKDLQQLQVNSERIEGKEGVSPPVHILDETSLRPVYIRLPKSGSNCQFTGLSHSQLRKLIRPEAHSGLARVKSVLFRPTDFGRGCRLIDLNSLLGYIELFAEEGNAYEIKKPIVGGRS
ncbi:MAG: hypothetical protein MI807_13485 [Verrucomicrobiales bacterium]|nr:hypothetical protein [Verrucomicrobiales bacterium]